MVNSKTVSTLTTLDLEAPAKTRPKVGFVSLGCPKNLVDSEVMMGLLHHNGAQLTPDAEDAEIIVINTCSFIDSAKQESVNTILEMVQHKQAHGGKARRIVVAGCLVERYRDEIRKNIPEVDAVVGTGELEHILAAAGLSPAALGSGNQAHAPSPFHILTSTPYEPTNQDAATTPGAPYSPAVSLPERVGSEAPQNSVLTPVHPSSPTVISSESGIPDSFAGGVQRVGFGAPQTSGLTPEDLHQTSIEAHLQQDLAILPDNPVGDTLVHRAASSVSQHSRPLSDPGIAPQLRIAAQLEIAKSLSETGTTHGSAPLTHPGQHTTHVSYPDKPAGNSGPFAPQPTSRPEGDARFAAGRFSRESWDGATAQLPDYLYTDATPRILATPRASAYIKIAEGCDHPCSFCIIPQLRGKFRSRRIGSILAEAQNLIAQGVREITLIGQDTTCYGEDLGLAEGLSQLLDALAPLPGLKWLRFLYTYPNKVTTRLLETIARHPNIAKYLDVPLQHASRAVLKSMKRGGSGDIFLRLIEKARAIVPGIVIRTSFIVGFPGETEADFQILCDFIQAARIDWLGVFTYSDEEGAQAFNLAAEHKLPRRTIETRRRKLMRLQQKISMRAKRQWIGRELDILVEGPSEETDLLWEGRTLSHAPEIDGKVFLNDFGPHEALVPGTFYRAVITESHDYDLVAKILD